jgi:hypothetical protein
MNNRDGGRFRRITRARTRAWWKGKIPLAEQFAEAYSFCALPAHRLDLALFDLRLRAHAPPAREGVRADRGGRRRPQAGRAAAAGPGDHALGPPAAAAAANPEPDAPAGAPADHPALPSLG